MEPNPKEEIERLKKLINYHNNLYYNLDNPILSDTQYDELYKQLKDLEDKYPQFRTKNSPTQRIGGQASNLFSPVVHAVPMMSLDNSYSAQDIRDWYARAAKLLGRSDFKMVVEAKIDGISCSLTYQDGKLITAASRGDGKTGEDITPNVLTVQDIPHILPQAPSPLEIRGEVYLEKKDLQALNDKQRLLGENIFANTRNAAAGSLRQKDSSITAHGRLNFLPTLLARGILGRTASAALSNYAANGGLRSAPCGWKQQTWKKSSLFIINLTVPGTTSLLMWTGWW